MRRFKLLNVERVRGSVLFNIVNFKTQEAFSVYFQLSLMDPWWIPKYDPNFLDGKMPLYGWLFFYFGRITEGVVCVTDNPDAKIKDSDGKRYNLYTFDERSLKDEIRAFVKKGNYRFEMNKETNNLMVIEN